MAQGQAQAILTALTDAASTNELKNLSGAMIHAISTEPRLIKALGATIGSDNTAVDNIFQGIGNGTMVQLSAAIAAQSNIHRGIDRGIAANLQPGALISNAIDTAVRAGAGAPVAAAAAVDFKLVKYTDLYDTNGAVVEEMKVEELFKRDPLLYNSQTGQYKDLAAMLGNFDEDAMRREYMESGTRDVPKLRYAMSAYIESPLGTPGPLPTGVLSASADKQRAHTLDRENLEKFSRAGTWSKEENPWRTPDNFIDFRRLLLKKGYVVTSRNNAVDTQNDVYVYYFNKENAHITDAILEVPFDSSNFILPTGWKVYARYPDGVLMYNSPRGVMQAEFPPGTFFKSSTTRLISRFETAAQDAVAAQKRRIDAIGGLSPDEKQSMYQFAAYLGIMQEMKNFKHIRGGSHNITHRRRMSVKRNKKMTRSSSSKGSRRGRGKGRARAASMLKSAKQRYYKMGGMRLGLGQSTPQPLQTESPLISQASPV